MKAAVLKLKNLETNEVMYGRPIYWRRAESPEALTRLAKNMEKDYAYNLVWQKWVDEGKIIRGNTEEARMLDWDFVGTDKKIVDEFEREVDECSKKFEGSWEYIEKEN